MGSVGPLELLLIFLAVLLLFGAKRIPEIARGLGKGIREFKDATSDIKRELTIDDSPPPSRGIEAPRPPAVAPEPRYDSPAQQHYPPAPHPPASHPPAPHQPAPQHPTEPPASAAEPPRPEPPPSV